MKLNEMERNAIVEEYAFVDVLAVSIATSDKPQNGSIYLHKHNHACDCDTNESSSVNESEMANFEFESEFEIEFEFEFAFELRREVELESLFLILLANCNSRVFVISRPLFGFSVGVVGRLRERTS